MTLPDALSLAQPPEDSLRCKVCHAEGFEPCDLRQHLTTFTHFAAFNAREHRLWTLMESTKGDRT